MKKILVLGGTKNQVPLIRSAKECGLFVVVCDWTTTNPGIPMADKHYQVSTMDRDAVLRVAEIEHIDGVVSNSEPAMANVAFIAEKLHLVGNPVRSVEALTSKVLFRDLQNKSGLFSPRHYLVNDFASLLDYAKTFSGPFVVKPVRSSGSRGTTCFDAYSESGLAKSFNACVDFSADHCCAIEEYVEMPSLDVIDGDVFLHKGKILWDGLFCSTRSERAPLVPMTQSYPLSLSVEKMAEVKRCISDLLLGSGATHGEYNIEAYFTKEGRLFVIEINPRQGGNHIPTITFEHSGVDMTKLLVTTAVGDDEYFNQMLTRQRTLRNLTYHLVFSFQDGLFSGLNVSDEIKKYVRRIDYNVVDGGKVRACDNATSVVAFVLLEFPDVETQTRYRGSLERYVSIRLK